MLQIMKRLLMTGTVIYLSAAYLWAVPLQIPVQGYLYDAAGTPYTTTKQVEFRLYRGGSVETAESGDVVFKERADITPSTDGTFEYLLGSGGAVEGHTLTLNDFDTPLDVFLEIQIDSFVLIPRIKLSGVPYAFIAKLSESIKDGTIKTESIIDGAVTTEKIKDGTIQGIDLAPGTLQGVSMSTTTTMQLTGLSIINGAGNTAGDPAGVLSITTPDTALTANTANLMIYTNDNFAVGKGGSLGFGGRYQINTTAAFFAGLKAGKENAIANDPGAYLSFATRESGGSVTEKLRINNAGTITLNGSLPSIVFLGGSGVANGIDFGGGASDDLVASDVTTLTSGGDANSLHTHTGLTPGDGTVTRAKLDTTSFQASGEGLVPAGAVLMFVNTNVCPAGFTRLPSIDNRYVIGADVNNVDSEVPNGAGSVFGSKEHLHGVSHDHGMGSHTHDVTHTHGMKNHTHGGTTNNGGVDHSHSDNGISLFDEEDRDTIQDYVTFSTPKLIAGFAAWGSQDRVMNKGYSHAHSYGNASAYSHNHGFGTGGPSDNSTDGASNTTSGGPSTNTTSGSSISNTGNTNHYPQTITAVYCVKD